MEASKICSGLAAIEIFRKIFYFTQSPSWNLHTRQVYFELRSLFKYSTSSAHDVLQMAILILTYNWDGCPQVLRDIANRRCVGCPTMIFVFEFSSDYEALSQVCLKHNPKTVSTIVDRVERLPAALFSHRIPSQPKDTVYSLVLAYNDGPIGLCDSCKKNCVLEECDNMGCDATPKVCEECVWCKFHK